jgi:long-chain fatty acid transport protein
VKYTATGGASGQEQESTRAASWIPSIAFSMPFGDRLAFGIGLFGVAGMGVDYPADLYGSSTMTSYMQARLTPAVAVKIIPGLSAGLTLNAMWASMEYAVGGTPPPNGPGLQPRDTASSYGYGATLGLQWTITPIVTVGAAYETKSEFSDFEFDIPAHTIGTPGGLVDVPGGTEKLAFDQPPVFSIGASVKPLPMLVIAADVQWIQWSKTNGENQPEFTTDPNLTGMQPWNLDWADQTVFKIGAEMTVIPLVKLRLGYDYGKIPLNADRAFEDIAFPAIAESHYTGGVAVTVGPLIVSASAVYSPEAKISGSNPAQGIATYDSKMSQMAFDLGASMSF